MKAFWRSRDARLGSAVHCRGQEQREQRGAQHDGGDGQVPPRDEEEDGDGGAQSDRDLGQILAEEGLQLLDAVDDRQHNAAGSLGAKPCRAQRQYLVEQARAQHFLHPGRGVVRDHGAGVIQRGSQQNRRRGREQQGSQVEPRVAPEDAGKEAAQEGEASDADAKRGEAQQDGPDNAVPKAGGETPELEIEVHRRIVPQPGPN